MSPPRVGVRTVTAIVAVCCLLVLAAAHSPPGRSIARTQAISWLASQGLHVSADTLSYNLFTLTIHLRGVSMTASGASTPFLTARDVRLNLPWTVLTRGLHINEVVLTDLVLTVVRQADGSLNLPSFSGEPLPRLDVGRVRLDRGTLRYDDPAQRQHVEVRDLTLDFVPRDGRVVGRLARGSRVSLRSADIAVDGELEGALAYDGVSVTLDGFGITSQLGTVRVAGRAGVFGSAPALALRVDGTLLLEPTSRAFAFTPAAAGTVTLTGRVDGPRDTPSASLDVRSDEIRWQHLIARMPTVRLAATSERVTIESASLGFGTGVLDAHGSYAFDSGRARASATWRGIPVEAIAEISHSALGRTTLSGQADLDALLSDASRTLGLEASVRADTAGTRTLDGQLSLSSTGDNWRARTTLTLPGHTRVRGALTGAVPESGVMHSSIRGSITLDAADLPSVARAAGRLEVWQADWPTPESGRIHGRFDVAGTLTAPAAHGAITLTDLRAIGLGPLAAQTQLTVDPRRFTVRALEATVGGNRLTGDVTLERARDTLSGHLDLAVADFTTLGEDTVARWHPAGHFDAQIDLAGTASEPVAMIAAAGTGLAVAGQDLGTLSATATASTTAVTVSKAELRQSAGGRLLASGHYSLRDALTGQAHALRVQADALLLSPVWIGNDNRLPLAGQVNGSLGLSGTSEHPTGGGRLEVADLQWRDAYLERTSADVSLSDDGATIEVDAPAIALHARAVVALADRYTTTITADVATLVARAGSVAPPLLQEMSGRVRAHVIATGAAAAPQDATADIRIDVLELGLRGATLQLDEAAAGQYRAGDVAVQSLRIRTGVTRLALSGGIVDGRSDGLRATVDGSLQDLQPWMVAFGAPDALDAAGTITVTAEATGSIDRPVLTADARVAGGRVAWPNAPLVTDVTAAMTLKNGIVDVPAVDATWQGGSLNAQARMPLRFLERWLPATLMPDNTTRTATVQVRLDRLTPALAAPWIDAATLDDLSGTATVELDFSAERPELDAVTGTLRIPTLNLLAQGVPIEQSRPTRIDLTSGALRIADWEWTLAGSPLVVSGTAGVTPESLLDVRVDGRLDLAMLSLFLPNGAADGTGDLALSLRGTTSAPVAEGTLTLKDGEIQLSDPRVGLSGLTGALVFRPGRIDVPGIAGTLNGGHLTLAGGLDYRGTTFTGGSVSVNASNVALDVPEGVRTEVNAALTFAAAEEQMRLTGRLDILRGGYREPLSLAAALALAGRDVAVALAPETGASLLDEIDLNIAVASAEDLVVDNNYGRLALGLDLRMVGTLAQPSVVGRAEIREGGALFLGGRTYLVDRGVIDFTDPRAIVPNLDVTGRTRVDGANESGSPTTYDITLEITGTPETLKTALTSTPDRSQADIVSLLATGRLADQVGDAGTAIARDQFLGYLSGDTLGFAARAIGVDAIRFERGASVDDLSSDASLAGEVNPAQRLTVSRRLSNKAEVTVSQNLRDTGRLTWIAALTPGKSIELRALSRDDTSRSYEVRHDVGFGGPPLPPAPPRGTAGTRIVAVRVTGETAIPAREVEGQLRLRAGIRFDFLHWQEDRDRLRRLYVDRGYREARISARQVPTPADDGTPGVTLEY